MDINIILVRNLIIEIHVSAASQSIQIYVNKFFITLKDVSESVHIVFLTAGANGFPLEFLT